MKKVLALLLFSITVLLSACTQTVNGCKIREETQCSKFDMRGADLNYADLQGAHLRMADLSGAILVGANLYGTDLDGANLGGANLGGAEYNKNTKFPDDFDPEEAGMVLEE